MNVLRNFRFKKASKSSKDATKNVPRVMNSATSSPAGRTKDTVSLSITKTSSKRQVRSVSDRFQRVIQWGSTGKVSSLSMLLGLAVAVMVLFVSLFLRTKMAELSFAQSNVQNHIATLRQDIEARQTTLDDLEGQLPVKAQKLGMIPQQGFISIDLRDRATGNNAKNPQSKQQQNDKSSTQHKDTKEQKR